MLRNKEVRLFKKKLKDGMKCQGIRSIPEKQNRGDGTEAITEDNLFETFLELMEDMNLLI